MQMDHSKAIKGMSIAVIVISALGVIFCLLMTSLFNVFMDMANSYGYSTFDSYSYYNDYYYYDDYYDPATMQLVSIVTNALMVWACVCSIFTLVVGIISLRFGSDPQKLGMVFGWSVAGAVVSFIGSGIIVTILLIITAVFAHKDKQLYMSGYASAYPAPGAYAQSMPTAPVAPAPIAPAAPQPVAPAAPVAPVAPQPVAPQPVAAQPVASAPAQPETTMPAAPTTEIPTPDQVSTEQAQPTSTQTQDPNTQA